MLVMRWTAFAALAEPVIEIVCCDDEYYGWYQKPGLIFMKELFGGQENKTDSKNQNRSKRSMMLNISMKQGVSPNNKGKCYHSPFKKKIVYDIYSE